MGGAHGAHSKEALRDSRPPYLPAQSREACSSRRVQTRGHLLEEVWEAPGAPTPCTLLPGSPRSLPSSPPLVVGLLESVLRLRAGSSCHTPACSLPLCVGSHRGSEGSRDARQKPGRGPCLSLSSTAKVPIPAGIQRDSAGPGNTEFFLF